MKVCLRCKHENDEQNNYCINCGAPLKNICTNRNCINLEQNVLLPDEAAFCPSCGSETLFKSYGLTSSYLDIADGDLPF